MKALILTDLHGKWIEWFWFNLKEVQEKCEAGIIQIVLSLWDNYKEDLEIFKDINIPKLAVHWNNDLIRKSDHDWLEDYWFQNIHLKTVNINWITFWWIEWNMWLLFTESIPNLWNNKMNKFKDELNLIKTNLESANVIISHFPVYWIHDDINSWSHKWLEVSLDLINNSSDLKNFFHGHLHNSDKTKINNTLIEEVYWVKIVNLI